MADQSIRTIIARQRAAAITFGQVWADGLLGESQRLVPLLEGTLAGSGDVRVEEHPDRVDFIVSYSTPYAARRHEDTRAVIRVAGRQAKYLEEPMKRRAATFPAGMAAAMARVTS